MIKLKRPRRPCKAMVIAPSAPGGEMSQMAFDRARLCLRSLGIEMEPAPNLFASSGELALPHQLRLRDIRMALEDDEIDMLIALYGGYNAIDLLPELPYDVWRERRKPLVGLSDVTALHLALWTRIRLPGLHGPNLSNFAAPQVSDYTLKQLEHALFAPVCQVPVAEQVAEDRWYKPNAELRRCWKPHAWDCHRPGQAEGVLLGGNLSTMLALAGTPYFPDLSGAILFLESNTGVSIREIDRDLAHLALMGVFKGVSGVIFGAMGQKNEPLVGQLVGKHLTDVHCPILGGVTSSHVDPVATLALGARLRLDAEAGTLSYLSPFGDERP